MLLVQCTSYIEKTTRFFQSGCLIDIWYLFALPGSEGMTSNFHVVFPSFISILCLFPESVDFHASQTSALFALFWRHQCQSFISYISWKANKREGCREKSWLSNNNFAPLSLDLDWIRRSSWVDNSSQLCEATNQICSVTFEGICRDHMLCQAEYIAMHYQRDLLDLVTFQRWNLSLPSLLAGV